MIKRNTIGAEALLSTVIPDFDHPIQKDRSA